MMHRFIPMFSVVGHQVTIRISSTLCRCEIPIPHFVFAKRCLKAETIFINYEIFLLFHVIHFHIISANCKVCIIFSNESFRLRHQSASISIISSNRQMSPSTFVNMEVYQRYVNLQKFFVHFLLILLPYEDRFDENIVLFK